MTRLFILILLTSIKIFAASNDYDNLPYLDENFKVGLGMSYSKLESNSDVGNYYLLSAANPRLEISYSNPIVNSYRHKFVLKLEQEVFRPENDSFKIKSSGGRTASSLSWQPMWLSENKNFVRYFKFMAKNGQIITEIPNLFTTYGDYGDRYAIDAGVGFTWYGLTVSKFPLGFDAEILYTQSLFDHAVNNVYNGLSYRMGIEFEFKKRSLFSGWGMRGYYEYDDLKNNYSHVVHKAIGIVFSKAFVY